MFLSIFDIFKIGIGPSSSHTMGPMTAAASFLDALRTGLREPGAGEVAHVTCSLHGSLSFTGKGHATDRAVMLGLCGFEPATIDPDRAEQAEAALHRDKVIHPDGLPPLKFDPAADLIFDYGPPLPGHANGMVLRGFDAAGRLFMEETYYSVGGGFVMTAAELDAQKNGGPKEFHAEKEAQGYPYPFGSANEMLAMGRASGKSIAQMKWANEEANAPRAEIKARMDAIWQTMDDCIDRGLRMEGTLPGGLSVKRRAKAIHRQLLNERGTNQAQPHTINDWMSA